MAVYAGAIPPGPLGVVIQPVCFTRRAAVVRAILLATGGVLGALAGAVAGVALAGPLAEILPAGVGRFVAGLVGAIAGGAVGVALVRRFIAQGACPCPAGVEAFCLGFPYLRLPGGVPPIPLMGIPLPAPALSCALIPPGCP